MKTAIFLILALLAGLLIGARLGLFSGQPPGDLGVREGRLKPPSATRNSVSSQAHLHPEHPQQQYASIEALPLGAAGGAASLRVLAALPRDMPELRLAEQGPDYLRFEARTRWLRFVDDLEFWLNPAENVIEVRSASRLGREDFGVNRKRVERIRAAYRSDSRLFHPRQP